MPPGGMPPPPGMMGPPGAPPFPPNMPPGMGPPGMGPGGFPPPGKDLNSSPNTTQLLILFLSPRDAFVSS